jgi:hypothetical protein
MHASRGSSEPAPHALIPLALTRVREISPSYDLKARLSSLLGADMYRHMARVAPKLATCSERRTSCDVNECHCGETQKLSERHVRIVRGMGTRHSANEAGVAIGFRARIQGGIQHAKSDSADYESSDLPCDTKKEA